MAWLMRLAAAPREMDSGEDGGEKVRGTVI